MDRITCTDCGATIDPKRDPTYCPACGSGNRQIYVHDEARFSVEEAWQVTATSRYAEAWFLDALAEARGGPLGDRHARRREIVFAALCAESYLYEWTVAVFSARYDGAELHDALGKYFPKPDFGAVEEGKKAVTKRLRAMDDVLQSGQPDPGALTALVAEARRNLATIPGQPPAAADQWIRVPRSLGAEGLIPGEGKPNYDEARHAALKRIILHRNAIVHATMSRPEVWASDDAALRPVRTTTTTLAQLQPGRAVGVVADWIRHFHAVVGTPVPGWVEFA